MAQDWKIPTGDDLWQVVSRSVVEKVNEDSAGGKVEDNDFVATLDTRAKKAVEYAVKEVRGAIENGGRSPVSLTLLSVPPEGHQHTLAIAAWRLCLPVPSLLAVIMGEGGAYSPVGALYKSACDWLKGVGSGMNVTQPTDPAGQDYLTAVSDTNPEVNGIIWGDMEGSGVEYAAGQRIDPRTGAVTTLPIDFRS